MLLIRALWTSKITLMAVSLLFTFVFLELGARLFVDLSRHAPIGVHSVDPKHPTRFLSGHGQTYETSEFRYSISFNSHGRRDIEWTPGTIASPENILFIGDSFVLGNGVENDHTIPTRLEAATGREVFNFGMPGGTPRTYELLLNEALEAGFGAGTVLVGTFIGNDFYKSVLDEKPLDVRRAEPKRQATSRRPRSQLLTFLKFRVAHSSRFVGWALTAGSLLGVTIYDSAGSYIFLRHQTPEQIATFDRVTEFFGSMQELCDAEGRRFGVVIFPNRIQVENRKQLTNNTFDAELPNSRIRDYCESKGIACLDLLPALSERWQRHGEPLYYPIDRHFNERGTAVAASIIASFLDEVEARPVSRR
jgi:hypothetical protein